MQTVINLYLFTLYNFHRILSNKISGVENHTQTLFWIANSNGSMFSSSKMYFLHVTGDNAIEIENEFVFTMKIHFPLLFWCPDTMQKMQLQIYSMPSSFIQLFYPKYRPMFCMSRCHFVFAFQIRTQLN